MNTATLTLAQIDNALNYVAEMIATRPDAETYVPLYERLERELAARQATVSVLERARQRSQLKQMAAAA